VPTLPPEAQENTPEGAEAFVRHWVEVLNDANHGSGGKAIRSLSADACAQCAAIAETADNIARGRTKVEGGAWSVVAVGEAPGRPETGDLLLGVSVKIEPGWITRGSGDRERTQGARETLSFSLSWKGGWAVEQIRTTG